jgi:hypothetical protein
MAACGSGKVGHRSERSARQAAIAVGRKRTHHRPRVYACPDCHNWHLTSAAGQSRALSRRAHARLPEPRPVSAAEFAAWFAEHSRRAPV